MKRFLLILLVSLTAVAQAQTKNEFVIETKNVHLVLSVGANQKLYQSYLGPKLTDATEYTKLQPEHEAYVPAGTDNLFEPAIRVQHNDGNPSLDLRYASSRTEKQDNVTTAHITLKDPKYPVEVTLHFSAYFQEDVIKTWTEIKHQEKKPVILTQYASAMLHFDAPQYYLTQFHGDWAEEMRMEESKLTNGTKVLDSKLGSRANMYQTPVFFLSKNKLADETTGEVLAGTLAWTGNFRFAFDMDEKQSLRVVAGMNPYASEYKLPRNQTFTTPAFIFTYSTQGKGTASRNFHRWGRNYGILDGNESRYTLLNNWEATYFDFNEVKLAGLFEDAATLGVDLFLLDDGWFANKYPRNSDGAGLGDWQENKAKLPNGIGHLIKEAESKGVKFGIWLEPEMVNPKSELYEKHPDWILKLPNREEHLYRNQLILDLVNPKVQDFVFDVVDKLLTKHPNIAYIKWDNNRMMTNAYSPYLKENQSHLYIEYTRSLYKILDRLRKKHPHLPIMLCSGGGGRTDYGALPYFTSFWPSDNTDGVERVFIQWGYSYFFPSIALSSHVTSWGKQSLKFRTDVAMMGKLGFDQEIDKWTKDELAFSQQAVKNYKRLSEVIWKGDHYRLLSPYEGNRAAVMYVAPAKDKAVLYSYNLHTRFNETMFPVTLQGLDPQKKYSIQEINLFPGTKSNFAANGKTFSGDYLMKVGLPISPDAAALTSHIYVITAE
ncbi:alpha-galactosidase [Rufibacter hautae]|uniref:Alpha-galactosidase n=1 Tax=Rufibacter hautae TaxID=2595005 RepID=A0A5B6T9X7_9BACT|nr:alpha-galactosidase [Rufibacter hautae]KAA3436677.1 alpha-galactosidase [Rufibacter hautae]